MTGDRCGKKTISRTGLFLFPDDENEASTVRGGRVLLAAPDPQPSAEGWTRSSLTTPAPRGPGLPAQDDSLLPLPGPMYPDPNSR